MRKDCKPTLNVHIVQKHNLSSYKYFLQITAAREMPVQLISHGVIVSIATENKHDIRKENE